MFKNSNLFGVIYDGEVEEIKRIKVNKETQDLINKHFSDLYSKLKLKEKNKIDFDGRYKPDDDEILVINEFEIDPTLLNAIVEPISENTYDEKDIEINDLKFVFIGVYTDSKYTILFQKIQNSQHLSSEGIKLFQKKGTFESVGKSGFTLSSNIDAIYQNGELLFSSYFFARQLFDLHQYYITATDADINLFCMSDKLYVRDTAVLFENADTWVRRKIALINDSEVLKHNDIKYIKQMAIEFDLDIESKNEKGISRVVLPEGKKELKDLLKFFDEDLYKGIFSRNIYETNSKLLKK